MFLTSLWHAQTFVLLCTTCVGLALLSVSAYEFCISSFSHQPQIQYRFTVMLFAFTQSLLPLFALFYLLLDPVDDPKWRSAVSILSHLVEALSRFLGLCCAYSCSLHFAVWAHNGRLPRCFFKWTQLLTVSLMLLDCAQCVVCLATGSVMAEQMFICALSMSTVLHAAATCIALGGAIRASPRRDHRRRLRGLLLLIAATAVPVLLSTYFLTKGTVEMVASAPTHFAAIDQSPASSLEEYAAYRLVGTFYVVLLLWSWHIPKSLCCGGCGNIARDSLLFSCCVRCCSLEPQPVAVSSNSKRHRIRGETAHDFDFFNLEHWRHREEDHAAKGMKAMEQEQGREERRRPRQTAEETLESSRSASTKSYQSSVRKKPNMLSPATITAFVDGANDYSTSGAVPSSMERDSVEMQDLQHRDVSASSEYR